MQRTIISACGLITAATLCGGPPASVVAPTPTELDVINVTATRLDQQVFTVPYTVHVIDRAEMLGRRAVRTLPDALSETPGVMVQRTSYGQASPFLRGFTGFRTLMLIDGIRLNNAVFRDGPNQYWGTVDPFAVERIEVVMGPASVLYGSDAVGGTLNAISPTVPFLLGPEARRIRTSANYRYATAERSHVARAGFSTGLTTGVGISGGITRKEFADLRGGGALGVQPGTGYSERAGDVKLRARLRPGLELVAAYQRMDQDDVPRTHATVAAQSFAGTARGSDLVRDLDQHRELAYLQAVLRDPMPWLAHARVSFSWHRQAEEQNRVRANGRREAAGFVDDQYGLLLSFETAAARFGTLSYGLEYYHDRVSSSATDAAPGAAPRVLARGPVADDARYGLLGVYLQDQFRLRDRLEVTAGLRFSRAAARATEVDPDPTDAVPFGALDRTAEALTSSLRLRLDATRTWKIFGGVSQGFRAPNLSDYTSFELARSGERETPAPDLQPETHVSFEIGTKARIQLLRTELHATFFHTTVEDQITRFPTGRLIRGEREVTRANTGDGFTRGAEVGATVKLGRGWSLIGNFAWLKGEVDTYVGDERRREPASRIQPVTMLAGPRWRSRDGRFWAEATGRFARRQDRLSPGDIADTQRIPPGGTPGYAVYSVRGGWSVNSSLTLAVAVENILDEDYRVHGSGLNEPGLNGIMSVRLDL